MGPGSEKERAKVEGGAPDTHRSRLVGQFLDRHLDPSLDDKARVLLVSARSEIASVVHGYLRVASSVEISVADCSRLDTALAYLEDHTIDLVLLDPELPDVKGLWSVATFRLEAPQVPMVVLLGKEERALRRAVIQLGAHDSLIMGDFGCDILVDRIFATIERQRSSERLARLEQVDGLTGLPGRDAFDAVMLRTLTEARRQGDSVGLVLIDIDNFKFINDTMGREIGDAFLSVVGDRLRKASIEGEVAARYGGDSFAIVIPHLRTDVGAVAERFREAMARPLHIGRQQILVTVSVGVATYPECASDALLFQEARDAVLLSKRRGKNRTTVASRALQNPAMTRELVLRDLRRAVEEDELRLYYQPKVDIRTGQVEGVEALIRWEHQSEGVVSPERFVPLLEESGLIIQVGQWLLRTACEEVGELHHAMSVAVNVSAVQFGTDFVAQVTQALNQTQLDPARLSLELTESLLFAQGDGTMSQLRRLKEMGVKLAVDDFGTGFSSLSYLNRYPIDEIKIDRSFVQNLTSDPRSATIAGSIIGLGHSLGMQVIAEGVETPSQLDFLKLRACDTYQGFLCAEPMPADELMPWLVHRNS